ncbi:UAA transporter [Cubamyces sp. BRFM 1775]|nr:UAA transporter [Cubamyces sp. BRFM 1775]
MSASDILRGLSLGVVSDWATTLGLIFGGCCSNAVTMEQLTREHPHSGSLITFAQFVLISLHGLPKFLVFAPLGSSTPSPPSSSPSSGPSPASTQRGGWWTRVPVPRLRPRRTPLAPYLAQVALFYAVSLLNNAAFGYAIPMSVHIIFRSGGLVISMLMGWLLAGKRYNLAQILSVLVVTAGVMLTTFSASASKQSKAPSSTSSSSTTMDSEPLVEGFLSREQWRYATGIAILTFALFLSGVLGILQDWTYARYVRAPASTPAATAATTTTTPSANGHAQTNGHANRYSEKAVASDKASEQHAAPAPPAQSGGAEPWQESMFYLHFLSLPMFYFVRHDLAAQARAFTASPPLAFSLAIPSALRSPVDRALTLYPPFGLSRSLLDASLHMKDSAGGGAVLDLALPVPSAYVALALTALTAHVCVAGVHRLTARGVSALAVTLLLVVRKATSLVLSVVLFRAASGAVNAGVWAGAGMVFAGTMGYAAGSRKRTEKAEEKRKKE